jgi:copper resistance protein C
VKLADESGAVVAETTQSQASRDMTLEAPALRPGAYRVVYRVLSTDGDVVEGKVEFVVVGAEPEPKFAPARISLSND